MLRQSSSQTEHTCRPTILFASKQHSASCTNFSIHLKGNLLTPEALAEQLLCARHSPSPWEIRGDMEH